MRVRLFSDIGHVMTKIDWEEPTKIKMCMYTVCWGLKYDDRFFNFYFRRWTVVRVRLFSDIGHVMTKIDWEEPAKIKMCMYTVCWGLKYDDVPKGKTCDRGTMQSPILT